MPSSMDPDHPMYRWGRLLLLAVLGCGTPSPEPASRRPGPKVAAEPQPPPAPAQETAEESHQPESALELDASGYDAVLQEHVRAGRVSYLGLKADVQARQRLQAFVESAANMSEQAPLSSWLNVYNALVIESVLARHPIDSVMDVKGFFKTLAHRVAGQDRTLDQIENEVIRKRFEDARIHMALNCAAVSCPALYNRAFVEDRLEADLTALTEAALADPTHVSHKGDRLEVSAIFFWFEADFKRDAGSVLAWIRSRAGKGQLRSLPEGLQLVQRDYDWKLAEVK